MSRSSHAATARRRPALAALAALALAACGGSGEEGERLPPDLAAPPPVWLGADLSYVNEMIDCGAEYRLDGAVTDPYEIFADKGANLVRLRLWVDPDWTRYSDFSDVKRAIAEARGQGMQVLLDFHYSDDWADPGDQVIPAAWSGKAEDTRALADAVRTYTYQTLKDLAESGLLPDMVQVGNETNTEILMPGSVPEDAPIDWDRNAVLLNAGIEGVQMAGEEIGTTPLIMLHIAQPESAERWFADATASGVTGFDVIGLSYYPKWSSEDLDALTATIRRLRARYNRPVMVVETAYPFTLEGEDEADNILGEDSLMEGYPATLDGQKRFLEDLTQAVLTAGGSGTVYWEPAWISTGCTTRWGKGSHWENNAFFTLGDHEAHSGFDFLSARYDLPAAFAIRIPAEGRAGETAWLATSLFGDVHFLIPLTADEYGWAWTFHAPAGEPFSVQLFADEAGTQPLLAAETDDGWATVTPREDAIIDLRLIAAQ